MAEHIPAETIAYESDRNGVWVVETRTADGRWVPMSGYSSSVERSTAWAIAREDRKKWPDEKFRVRKYISVQS